ncbi:MAG: sigma-70 family RNA polymerase sigma factor [Defluviitaleaceae bacterium]|nr:sigma-70 family RNA polymerase sigma factor [Defluviitaleaceae bacterium]
MDYQLLYIYMPLLKSEEEKQIFADLYNEVKNTCLNIALKITNNHAMAEDILHDVFIKIIKNKDTIFSVNQEQRKAYAYKSTVNRARDLISSHDEKLKDQLDEDVETADDFDLCYIVEKEEAYQKLITCIKALPLIYRVPFDMRYAQDMKNYEIAKELGITENTVSKRIIKAKLKLRDMMDKGA